MSNEEASELALRLGQKWRVEVFDAQLGGSVTLYYASREAANQGACRAGGKVQRYDGCQWREQGRGD